MRSGGKWRIWRKRSYDEAGGIYCSPCLKEVCPLDHRCMLSIEPHEVWREMEDLEKEVL